MNTITKPTLSLALMCCSFLMEAQVVELNKTQVENLCSTVRFKDKGQTPSYNYWRYEELMLEYAGSSVEDANAVEVIKDFVHANYAQCYCDPYQAYPEGGLLQQFVASNFEDGLYDFVEIYEIDFYSVRDRNGTLILPWIDERVSSQSITDDTKAHYKKLRDGLIDRFENNDADDF